MAPEMSLLDATCGKRVRNWYFVPSSTCFARVFDWNEFGGSGRGLRKELDIPVCTMENGPLREQPVIRSSLIGADYDFLAPAGFLMCDTVPLGMTMYLSPVLVSM